MRCRICNAYIPEGATHCLECGSDLNPPIVCQRCGAETSPNARYCRTCGNPVSMPPEVPYPGPSGPSPAQESSPVVAKCPVCGSQIPTGLIYCPTCGTNQSAVSSPTSDAQTIHSDSKSADETVSHPDGSESSGPAYDHTEVIDAAKPCPRCGTVLRGSGRFCYNCGRFMGGDIEDVICPACGANNILRYARCQYCGADLPPRQKIST